MYMQMTHNYYAIFSANAQPSIRYDMLQTDKRASEARPGVYMDAGTHFPAEKEQ